MYTWCNTWYNWDCAGTWVILKKKIKIMLLIKTAWYYRKRRLCRGRRRYGKCCHGHSDTLLPREVWGTLVESSWERGVLEGRHHLQRTEVAISCCSQGLTLVHLPLDEILWIICAPESQTDFFWDSMVPCCTPSWTSRCFHPSKKLKILQIRCKSNTENFITLFCKPRAIRGGHSHIVTPAPFPCTAQTSPLWLCSQVTSHNPVSLRDRMNWATSEWQGPRLYSHWLEGHNTHRAFSNQKWRTPNFHFQPPKTMLCPAVKERVNTLRKKS